MSHKVAHVTLKTGFWLLFVYFKRWQILFHQNIFFSEIWARPQLSVAIAAPKKFMSYAPIALNQNVSNPL